MFLNLSNHPVATWPTEQLEAAGRLGLGPVRDLAGGMPVVPADADEDVVVRLAHEVAERAHTAGCRGAFVASDYTLTFALVMELRAGGVRCFAATTERQVGERPAEGGGVEVTRIYRFVRWREYR